MEKGKNRFSPRTPTSDMAAMSIMLYSLPPQALTKVDAFAVFPGLGETWRLVDAVRHWEASNSARFFFIAGQGPNEVSWESWTVDRLELAPFSLRRREGVVTQRTATNTKDQAEWLSRQVYDHNAKSLALCASPFHLLRAYLTVLKTFLDAELRIPFLPAPTRVNPSWTIPEVDVNAWALVPGEVERIEEYQAKGWIATTEEFQSYLQWLWEQKLLTDALR